MQVSYKDKFLQRLLHKEPVFETNETIDNKYIKKSRANI